MAVTLIEPPLQLPVELSAAKAFLRVEHDHEDMLIEDLARAATTHVEAATGLKLIAQGWRQFASPALSDFARNGEVTVALQLMPVLSVEAITVYDQAGNPQPVDPAIIRLNAISNPASVSFVVPNGITGCANGVEIDFTCGHSASREEIPPGLRHAVLVLLSHWYAFRGAVNPNDQPVSLPNGFEQLLAPFRRVRL